MPPLVDYGTDLMPPRSVSRENIGSQPNETLSLHVGLPPDNSPDALSIGVESRSRGETGSPCPAPEHEPERWDGLS